MPILHGLSGASRVTAARELRDQARRCSQLNLQPLRTRIINPSKLQEQTRPSLIICLPPSPCAFGLARPLLFGRVPMKIPQCDQPPWPHQTNIAVAHNHRCN